MGRILLLNFRISQYYCQVAEEFPNPHLAQIEALRATESTQ